MSTLPRIVFLAGPLAGRVVPLEHDEMTLGRHASNTIPLNSNSVSRRHCVIRRESGQFRIIDQESLNGTFVNGIPILEHRLEHGNEVRVGDSVLVYLDREDDLQPAASSGGPSIVPEKTIRLRREDAIYLQPDRILNGPVVDLRMARNLGALLKISSSLSSATRAEDFHRRLVESLADTISCDQCILLLRQEGEFAPAQSAGRNPGAFSRTAIQEVLSGGASILCNDIPNDPALASAASLVRENVCSILCVPLFLHGSIEGILYMDSRNPAARFEEDHLQLLTAAGAMAAAAMEKLSQMQILEAENRRLREDLRHGMIGHSPAMRDIFSFVGKVAPTDATVLILGESGTGKELVARALHENSNRRDHAFLAINCAALSDALLESDLFGHEKGAFTGAVAQKKGKLELADRGTVFLDEVGELNPSIQAKLLRVLEEHEFHRVGGTKALRVDIRLIAASNRDLREAVQQKSFRDDLFYRLNVVSIKVPPLRERREDIPLLASYFLSRFASRLKKGVHGFTEEGRRLLAGYPWPGNVRELENAIERAVVLCDAERIGVEDLPEALLERDAPPDMRLPRYQEAVLQTKKQLILRAVEESGGSIVDAASLLGIHVNYLHRLIRNMNLKSLLKAEK